MFLHDLLGFTSATAVILNIINILAPITNIIVAVPTIHTLLTNIIVAVNVVLSVDIKTDARRTDIRLVLDFISYSTFEVSFVLI